MKLLLWIVYLIGFVVSSELAQIQIADSVTVSGKKLILGEIARIEGQDTRLCEQLKTLELGVSPVPGQKRAYTRQQLITRLRQHQIPLQQVSLNMPDKITIERRSQTMESSRLTDFAREQLRAVLGLEAEDWVLQTPPHALALPEGEIELKLEGSPQIGREQARITVAITQSDKALQRITLLFHAPARSRAILIKSGTQVVVRAVSEDVMIITTGVARGSGAAGEEIPVFLTETKKIVRAIVLDKETVEMRL